jgi:hypothetical protein
MTVTSAGGARPVQSRCADGAPRRARNTLPTGVINNLITATALRITLPLTLLGRTTDRNAKI